MTAPYPEVPIGQVAILVARPEAPLPGSSYRLIGVRLWGQGPYERETIDGSETKYAALSRVEAGDIVVNKIWARNGSVGVVSDDLDGCYGSNEFPTFAPIRDALDPRWFYWITKTRGFWEQCDEKSRGTSGQNRIRPERFLEILIPLPPLDEQRRIVTRIEELAAKIEVARGLRRSSVKSCDALLDAELDHVFMSVAQRFPSMTIQQGGGFVTSGPRGWGDYYSESGDRRLIRVENVVNRELNLTVAAKVAVPPLAGDIARSQVEVGDVLVTITGAAIGRVGVVREFDIPCHVSQHVALVRPPATLRGDYLYWFLQSPTFGRRQTEGQTYGATKPGINLTSLRTLSIPTPPICEQVQLVEYFVNVQSRIDAFQRLRSQTANELDALLPSVLDKAFRGEM